MVLTDNEALNKIVEILAETQKIEKLKTYTPGKNKEEAAAEEAEKLNE